MTYLFILIGYSAVMIALGVWWSRRVRGSEDFFVAGRGLNAWLVCATLLAANIGAGSTVGATGLGYKIGLSAWWWVGSAGIGSLLLAFTVGPRIWRVARAQNLFTVGDYLEFRYSRTVRGMVALLLWIGSLVILAGQLIAMEQIFRVTAGLSRTVGCLLAAAVITIYFTAGGLHATARVNVLQLVVKLVGFALALGYLLNQSRQATFYPPFSYVEEMARNLGFDSRQSGVLNFEGVFERYRSLIGVGLPGVLGYLALLVPSFIVSPGLLQKIFGARDERAVRLGVGLNAVGLLAFAAIPALLGMIARDRFPELANPELALPRLLTDALPLWLGGVLLGALFSAELSAADAALFMLTTSLSKDLYQTFLKPQATDAELLRVVRWTAVACGVLGAGLALLLGSVIAALKIFYTLLSAALLLPLIAGLYTRRVTARAALAAMLSSVALTFALERLTKGSGYAGVPPLLWGTLLGLVVMLAFSLVERGAKRAKSAREV